MAFGSSLGGPRDGPGFTGSVVQRVQASGLGTEEELSSEAFRAGLRRKY